MARATKLKVFRTAAGFYDAYVAAPSRKAALAAWGSDHDLFARGVAEEVTDAALMEAPLASPGTVVKRSRGTTAEQIAAMPEPARRKAAAPATQSPAKPEPKRKAKPPPKPGRETLDAAEAALKSAEADRDAVMRDLAAREAALAKERRDLERREAAAVARAQAAADAAREAHKEALRRWRQAVT